MINIGLVRLSPPQWLKVGRGQPYGRRKKLLSCLADFGCYGGWRVGVNLLKKVKVCGENLFSDSVDVKTDRNKKLVAVSFYKK